jgi:predicted DNA-binding transcriptional regulator AlpA
MPMSRWLSVKDIAADLSISIHTAYKWSSRGEPWFPRTIRLRNGDLRVRRDWYELWLARMEPQRANELAGHQALLGGPTLAARFRSRHPQLEAGSCRYRS